MVRFKAKFEQDKEKATKLGFLLFRLTFACDKSLNKCEAHFSFITR